MIGWLLGIWHKRQRAIDEKILWPSVKQQAATLTDARRAFAHHAYTDQAWLVLGDDEIQRRIGELT